MELGVIHHSQKASRSKRKASTVRDGGCCVHISLRKGPERTGLIALWVSQWEQQMQGGGYRHITYFIYIPTLPIQGPKMAYKMVERPEIKML